MKTKVYSIDSRNTEFSVEEYVYSNLVGDITSKGELIWIRGQQSASIFFASPEEIDEFCELLQEKKKEIWKS